MPIDLTRFARVVVACAFLPSFISADQAGRRQFEAITVGAGGPANGSAVLFTQEPPPAFRTGVNLAIIDVQVVAAQGKPVPDLTTAQFAVSIGGRKRRVVLAEFVHADEGPIHRTGRTTRVAACVFGFERIATGINAHYLLGVEPSDSDKSGIKRPTIKVNHKDLTARRWAWRYRVAAPHDADGEQGRWPSMVLPEEQPSRHRGPPPLPVAWSHPR
jgi:hypothetical protein